MPAMESEERCGVLMALFQTIINDMKENAPAFEDLANKTTKLHSSLRATIASTTVFLEAFQRVADVATNSRGATKEIGKALTRLCLRQRSIESKLKTFTSTLLERLVVPLQETVAEWQKAVVQLDKDHARECKKARADIKRASGDTVRLQRKAKKGKSDAKERLESAMQGVSDMYTTLEESEKKHVRLALIQERKQFCHFITCVDPIVAAEVSMINEAMHLQEILDSLCSLAADPDNLPEASEHVIADASRADIKLTTTFQSPPGSPASLVRSSRRSSLSSLSSMASASEADSAIGVSPNHGSGQKISHGSDGDLLGDQSSLSSKHSSYHSGGRGSAAGAIGTAAAADEVFDSVSLHVPLVMGGQYQQRSLDRPHTISAAASNGLLGEMVARQQYSNRPSLQADTFVPLQPSQPSISAASAGTGTAEQTYATSHSRTPSPVMLVPPSPAAVMMPPPPKPSRGVLRRDTVHGTGGAGGTHRNLPPRVIRAKPVALPSVPFMASEPVYMNTQELAARIAEKRHASELQQQSLQQQQYEATHQTAADRKSSVDQPQSYHHQQQQVAAVAGAAAAAAMRSSAAVQPDQNTNPGTALANAIKELEASTAALNDACDGADQLPPPPDSLNVAQSRASVDEDQLRPLREVGYAKRVPEAGATADHAVHLTDHDALRIAQGRPVLTSAGPAVLRRTASIKPPPPMRKSSSVTSPRSLEAEYVPKGVSLAGSVTSIPSAAAPSATGAATSQAAEPVRPGSAGLSATPAIDGAAASAAAATTTTAVVRRSADAVDHGGAVTAAIATVAAASVIPSPAADHTDRNSRGSTPAASAASLPATGQPPAVAAVKALPPAVAAKAPPPAVAAKPAARRDLGGGSSTGSAVGLPEPAPAARPTSVPNGAVASSSGAATAAAAPAAAVAASLPPWERAPAASLPPWERGSAVASAATVAGSGSSATVAAVTVGQGAQQHRESASAPSFSRPGADFIASLGAKLAAGGGTSLGGGGGGDSTPSAASATASASALRSTGVSASAGGAAAAVVGGTTAALPTPHPGALQPAAVAGSEDNLMSQIHTGVKLKRTQTDDRSAPRVT